MKEIMTFSIILRMSDSLVEIPSLFKHKGLRKVGKGLKGGGASGEETSNSELSIFLFHLIPAHEGCPGNRAFIGVGMLFRSETDA